MAVKDGSGSQDLGHRFWPMLSYACGELCVIILLYVAALASYAATRLARICGLRPPCIMCTRLDRALHGKPWFSGDLVCACIGLRSRLWLTARAMTSLHALVISAKHAYFHAKR